MGNLVNRIRSRYVPPDTNTSAVSLIQEHLEKEKLYRQQRNFARLRLRLLQWLVWMDFAGTTTLHGPAQISTTRGMTRVFYCIVVTICAFLFFFHCYTLLVFYFEYPILTAIKYENMDFRYPDITLCPHSPFTVGQLYEHNETAEMMEKIYTMAKEKWWKNLDLLNLSPNANIKKSMVGGFFRNSLTLGRRVFDHVLFCELNGVDCLDQFILTEHPVYYRCFTLRLKSNPPFPAGPTHGVQIVLHRGLTHSQSLLVVDEDEPFLVQSNVPADNLTALGKNNSAPNPKDGFYIVFHESRTIPNYPLQTLSNGLTLRFGQFTRIGLTSLDMQSINIKQRPCVPSSKTPKIQLTRNDRMSESNFRSDKPMAEETLSEFEYTKQSCLANFRQILTKRRCDCFSESYSIPYSERHVGLKYCLSVDQTTSNVIKMPEIMACVEQIENMTDAEIVAEVEPSIPGDGLSQCPLRCDYREFHVELHYSSNLKQDFDAENFITYFQRKEIFGENSTLNSRIQLNGTKINSSDLIFLDISPISESVNQIIEDRAYSLIQLLSELGGVSGLYVGITMYTIAEFIDYAVRFLMIYIPYLWYQFRYKKQKKMNRSFQELMENIRNEEK
nr:expressed protein [Hymenolepis microstoma]